MGLAETVTIFASFLGSFVGALCGIGGYMVIIPIMALVLPIHTVILTCCLSGPFMCLLLCLRYGKHCRWRSLLPMLAGVVPGTFAGVWIISVVQGAVLQLLLGFVLLGFLVWQQYGQGAQGHESWQLGGFSGFVAGLLGASVSVDGPPVGAYGLYVGWAPQAFLGTLGPFYFCRSLFACVVQATAGLYTAEIVHLAMFGIVGGFVGTMLTFPLVKRVNVATFRMAVKGVILVAALSCLWHARSLFWSSL